MCLLCYIEPNAPIDWTGLENACENNPDGFGWALHHRDHIEVGRFMDASAALESFQEARYKAPDTMGMFHARWATHGAENLLNVHPFAVPTTEDSQTILAHNGVLNVRIPKDDWRSDTRYFVEEMLPLRSRTLWDKDKKVNRLRDTVMGGSKFVVFTTDPAFRFKAYIIGEELGHWSEGTWWSNDSYQYSWRKYKGWGNQTSSLDGDLKAIGSAALSDHDPLQDFLDDDSYCPTCEGWLTNEEELVYRYCSVCLTCLDCSMQSGDCMCYLPSTPSALSEELDDLPMSVRIEMGG